MTDEADISELWPDLDDWWAHLRHEVYYLRHRKELHDELLPRILAQSNENAVAAGFVHRMYLESQLMTIRRLTDTYRHKPTRSFRRLLGQLAEHPTAVTRSWFVARYVGDSSDPWRLGDAEHQFSGYVKPEEPDHLWKGYVLQDLDRLTTTTDELTGYVDDNVAHATAVPDPRSATTKHLNDALDLFDDLLNRYGILLMGSGEVSIAPLIAGDWKQPFRQPLW